MKRWLFALLLLASAAAQAEIYRIGLIGDVPYSAYERRELPRMLDVMADSQVDFIAHIGDIKNGKERCDDSLFEDRQRLFDASRVPFVFVPGDNEWTDCDRQSNGGYDPLERLAKLRSLFWPDAFSLGQKKLPLEQQPGAYPEHTRFRLGSVLFVTLNIPGGNNFDQTNQPAAEYRERRPAVLNWLRDSFALARREHLAGIVLLFQADPAFKHFANGFGHRAFREFLETLRAETLNFSGQVVAVHGDSHISRIDQPLRGEAGKTMRNFTRVETFGYPMMGWTRAIIDTESPTLIRFETHPWPTPQP